MVLILFGPLLTRVQLEAQGPGAGQSHHGQHLEPSSHPHHPGHHQPKPTPENASHGPLEHLAHGECGYCWLLVKLPAVAPLGSPTAWANTRISRTSPPAGRLQPWQNPRYASALVRAPPVTV